jgi:hypothetical protein
MPGLWIWLSPHQRGDCQPLNQGACQPGKNQKFNRLEETIEWSGGSRGVSPSFETSETKRFTSSLKRRAAATLPEGITFGGSPWHRVPPIRAGESR